MDLDIRPIQPGEVDRVGNVLSLARLHQGDGYYLVAWAAGDPVGHLHLALTDPPELQDVLVHADHQRRGVASALTRAAEAAVRARGARTIRLTVSADGEQAQALYRSLGFCETGLPAKRVLGPITIRTGVIHVDDTLLTWEKELA